MLLSILSFRDILIGCRYWFSIECFYCGKLECRRTGMIFYDQLMLTEHMDLFQNGGVSLC